MNIQIKDGRERLFQWDTGRVLVVDEPCDYVHFSNMPYGKALTVDVIEGEASIPDELLQSGAFLYCYVFIGSVQEGYTEKSVVFEVEKKPKPTDYVFTQTEYITLQDLDSRVKNLEDQGGVGFSPEVEIFPIENGHRVQITAAEGVKSFDVLNGKDGYTPQKGVDYYTEEEKKELIDELSASLPVVPENNWVSSVNGKTGTVTIPEPFRITAIADFANSVLTDVSKTFAEISTAYARGDHIFIEIDISQMMPGWKTTVPLTTLSENKFDFSNIVYAGSPMMGYCSLTSEGSSYVTIIPLASQADIEDINSALDAINGEVI